MPEPYPEFPDSTTLGEIRAWLREHTVMPGGTRCPACVQHAQVYRRILTSNMARLLIRAYRSHGQEWFHGPTALRDGTGDLAKLAHWGLVQESTERRGDGGRGGWWRVTDRGVAFLRTGTTVPSHILLYDGQLLGHDGRQISVRDALGERFDLAELMAEGSGVAPTLEPEGAQP